MIHTACCMCMTKLQFFPMLLFHHLIKFKNIMSSVFTFGKHSGKTFAYVAHIQPSYTDFLINLIRSQLLNPKEEGKPPVISKLFNDEVIPFVNYCSSLHIYDHLLSQQVMDIVSNHEFDVEETVEGEVKTYRNRFRTFSSVDEPPTKRSNMFKSKDEQLQC